MGNNFWPRNEFRSGVLFRGAPLRVLKRACLSHDRCASPSRVTRVQRAKRCWWKATKMEESQSQRISSEDRFRCTSKTTRRARALSFAARPRRGGRSGYPFGFAPSSRSILKGCLSALARARETRTDISKEKGQLTGRPRKKIQKGPRAREDIPANPVDPLVFDFLRGTCAQPPSKDHHTKQAGRRHEYPSHPTEREYRPGKDVAWCRLVL